MNLQPIDKYYLETKLELKPGNRLHSLVARMFDTYIDDLSEDRIQKLHEMVDDWRITHANGDRFGSQK